MQEIHKWREEIVRLKEGHKKSLALLQDRERIEEEFLKNQTPGLKEMLRTIDQELDELGEDHEEQWKSIEISLQAAIIENDPASIHELSVIDIATSQLKTMEEELAQLLQDIGPFSKTLGCAVKIHQGASHRTLLDKLFGRHPKVLLSHELYKAASLAKQLDKKPLTDPLKAFFKEFEQEVEKRWNQTLYKETLPNLYRQFMICHEEIEENLLGLRQELDAHAKDLDAWLHQVVKPG